MLSHARVGTRAIFLMAMAACTFPTPSEDYTCDGDGDCNEGRVCSATKFCVIPSLMPDAPIGAMDAAVPVDTMLPPPDGDPFAATRAACLTAGYAADPGNGRLYRVVATAANWAPAQLDCTNDVPGATHLIVLSDAGEVNFMKTKLGWVGLTDATVEGQWLTGTDEANPFPPGQPPWVNGQPDNGGGDENCAQMKSGGLDDDQCNNGHRYVCECDGRPALP